MSKEPISRVSTLCQGARILTLIDEQGLNLHQVQAIYPYLVALARGIKYGSLPDVETFRAIAEGRARVDIQKRVIDFNSTPYTPDGWVVLPYSEQLPHRMKGVMEFDPAKLDLYFDEGQKDGNVIKGTELRKKLKGVVVYGVQALDFLLKRENQHLIPKRWQRMRIYFWGTIYRHSDGSQSDGRLCIRYLVWNSFMWDWNYEWLDDNWVSDSPTLVPANQN